MPKDKIVVGKNNKRTAIKTCNDPCPIERGMRVIGGKWTGSILWHLKDEPMRFNDISRLLGGASKKMISQRLKEMEANKLVKRKVLNTQPVAVSYQLTTLGGTALSFLDQLKDWTIDNNF